MTLAVALALPFEVYLTALSLDVSRSRRGRAADGDARDRAERRARRAARGTRRDAAGRDGVDPRTPAGATGLWGRFAGSGTRRSTACSRLLALLLLGGLVVASRSCATGPSAGRRSGRGSARSRCSAIVAAVFALWVGFVHRRLQHADAVNANWLRRRQHELAPEHAARAARAPARAPRRPRRRGRRARPTAARPRCARQPAASTRSRSRGGPATSRPTAPQPPTSGATPTRSGIGSSSTCRRRRRRSRRACSSCAAGSTPALHRCRGWAGSRSRHDRRALPPRRALPSCRSRPAGATRRPGRRPPTGAAPPAGIGRWPVSPPETGERTLRRPT